MTNQVGKRPLPLLPHPDHLRKQAKAKLAAMKAHTPAVRLADAQRMLAEEYGFAGWAALQTEVARRTNGALGRRIRRRRSLVALLPRGERHSSGALQQGSGVISLRRRHSTLRTWIPGQDDRTPLTLLRAGIMVQVCCLVAVLVGVGVFCFALHRAGVPFRSDQGHGPSRIELLHRVI
jgi:hypothetical protein